MDAKVLQTVSAVFASLHTPVRLLARTGKSILPADGESFYVPESMPDEGYIQRAGYLFSLTEDGDQVLTVREGQGANDVLQLARALLSAFRADERDSVDIAYHRLLTKAVTVSDAEAIAAEHAIPAEHPRVVIALHMVRTASGGTQATLRELIPLAEGDRLVMIDQFSAALVKDMTGTEAEELREFASALHETLFSESAFRVTIGVSQTVSSLPELHPAYRNALEAMEVGRLFREGEAVHFYDQLMLERFLAAIPPDTAERYHRLLFNESTQHLLSDEMLDTINMFLAKDLNLSDTARQLYIHRNTLVYRLDKVQRQIGLDLRHFDDALTFKMLYHMKKCMRNRTHDVREEEEQV